MDHSSWPVLVQEPAESKEMDEVENSAQGHLRILGVNHEVLSVPSTRVGC